MTVRILLTGRSGQIGAELAALLPSLGEVVAPDRQQLDLTKPEQIRGTIQRVRPNLIVNAAAYTAVDQAETDRTTAQLVNADAPAFIAEEAKKTGAALVHYSTDYVFDGTKRSPYDENDPPNPLSVYGKTKLAGEQAIRDSGVPHLILRTAWVYATRGRNFLLTTLRLASQHEELKFVSDQIGAPTWSREIAGATVSILQRLIHSDLLLAMSQVSGLYHMTAGGCASRYDFAQAILAEASAAANLPWLAAATGGRPFVARRIAPVTTAEFPTPARRPAYSVLSNARLSRIFGIQLADWRVQLHTAFTLSNTP